jgi:hypothetical protein
VGLFADTGHVLPLKTERLETFISCYRYTSDGLSVLVQFMQFKKTVHFQYFCKMNDMKKNIWIFVKENVPYHKCCLKEKYPEE